MTVILFIASGFFVGLGFLFQYLNTHDEWLYWCSIGSWALAGVFALWAIISIILWAIDRRRRKAQLWHKRYVDLAAAQNTQKIILEFPQELAGVQEYLDRPVSKNASCNKSGKGKRKNGKR